MLKINVHGENGNERPVDALSQVVGLWMARSGLTKLGSRPVKQLFHGVSHKLPATVADKGTRGPMPEEYVEGTYARGDLCSRKSEI